MAIVKMYVNVSEAENRLKQLKALRGKHDQTIRTQAIHILYAYRPKGMTETDYFLETEIHNLETDIHNIKTYAKKVNGEPT